MKYRYAIQVFDGEAWMTSAYGGDDVEAAELAERLLREENGAWCNPKAPKLTRIFDTQSARPVAVICEPRRMT